VHYAQTDTNTDVLVSSIDGMGLVLVLLPSFLPSVRGLALVLFLPSVRGLGLVLFLPSIRGLALVLFLPSMRGLVLWASKGTLGDLME